MGKPFKHSENLTRGDKFSLTWTGGEAGDSWDWSSVAISMKIIDTSDNSTVATLSPTTGLSGDSNEIVTAAFNVADTSSWATGTLRGDIEVSGEPTLGTHTPVEVTIYVTADITT